MARVVWWGFWRTSWCERGSSTDSVVVVKCRPGHDKVSAFCEPVVDTGHGQGVKALGDGVVRDDMSLRLPGYTSHGPVVPRESRDPGAVVRSTTEDWEARAAAADRAAELLQEAIMRLGQPLKQLLRSMSRRRRIVHKNNGSCRAVARDGYWSAQRISDSRGAVPQR